MDKSTQETRVLKMLKANRQGVANYQFANAGILRYSARILRLRKDGYGILSQRQKVNGRATGVWLYFLESEPA